MDPAAVARAKENWETIAPSFAPTRTRPWRPVVDFLGSLAPGSRVADIGGGAGRHALAARSAGHSPVLIDLSRSLLMHASGPGGPVPRVQGLMERLPVRDASFDAITCIAAIHHVQGRAHRAEAWAELVRVLRPGSRLLACTWARDQPRFSGTPPRPGPEPGDAWIPWKAARRPVERFYHLYEAGELGQEAGAAGLAVEREWSQALAGAVPDNHFVLARLPD